ncbi:MAG: DUF2157 domain-containing protein [Deltaproteobacteria bacterium]|nr:DUF2157 domain-containing protein [Deltaproteobacteria bacterium]
MRLLRFLKRELAAGAVEWVRDGIVSKDQAEKILERYGAEYPTEGKNKDRGYLVLMSLAALMVGVAVIIIIGANWDEIPRWTRMTLMIAIVAVTNGLGLYEFKKGETGAAGVILLLGSLFYGAAIMLIAQIYHLGEHYPSGIFMWALGVVPVGMILGNRAIILVAQVLSCIWMTMEFDLGYLPLFYFAFSACFWWFCIKIKPSVFIYLLSLAGFVTFLEFVLTYFLGDSSHGIHFGVVHVFYSVSILLVLISGARNLESDSSPSHVIDYAMATRIWAFRLGLIFLFVLSFEEPVKELLGSTQKNADAIMCIGGVTLLLVVLGFYRRVVTQAKTLVALAKDSSLELAASAFFCAVCLLITYIDKSYTILVVILVNLLLLWTGIHVLLRGIRTHSGVQFHVGLAIILTFAICRYFSLIGEYWGGAAMFGFAGLVMFFAARYWRIYQAKHLGEDG